MTAHLFGMRQHKKVLVDPLRVLATDPTACFDDAFVELWRKNMLDFNWQHELALQVSAAKNDDLNAINVVTKAYDYFATATEPAIIDLIESMRVIAEANCSFGVQRTNR